MIRNFVKCGYCGKPIFEDDSCVTDRCCIGVFCSVECWALEYGNFRVKVLNKDTLEYDAAVSDFEGMADV